MTSIYGLLAAAVMTKDVLTSKVGMHKNDSLALLQGKDAFQPKDVLKKLLFLIQ